MIACTMSCAPRSHRLNLLAHLTSGFERRFHIALQRVGERLQPVLLFLDQFHNQRICHFGLRS